jgi:hypothetical protein
MIIQIFQNMEKEPKNGPGMSLTADAYRRFSAIKTTKETTATETKAAGLRLSPIEESDGRVEGHTMITILMGQPGKAREKGFEVAWENSRGNKNDKGR